MGPLQGLRIIEVAGIGPGPFAAMMLSDMGADVIRVDRSANAMGGDPAAPPADIFNRGRRSIALDLKSPDGVATLLDLVEHAAKSEGLSVRRMPSGAGHDAQMFAPNCHRPRRGARAPGSRGGEAHPADQPRR